MKARSFCVVGLIELQCEGTVPQEEEIPGLSTHALCKLEVKIIVQELELELSESCA